MSARELQPATSPERDLPPDTDAWLNEEEAYLRIRSCRHPLTLDFLNSLLTARCEEEDARRQILDRKASALVGATALALGASGWLGIRARDIVAELGAGAASSWTLAVLSLSALMSTLLGALALWNRSTAVHSDNVILNRIAIGRAASLHASAEDSEAVSVMIPHRHIVLCNLWTVVEDSRRANNARARLITWGHLAFAFFVLLLGAALVVFWIAAALID